MGDVIKLFPKKRCCVCKRIKFSSSRVGMYRLFVCGECRKVFSSQRDVLKQAFSDFAFRDGVRNIWQIWGKL